MQSQSDIESNMEEEFKEQDMAPEEPENGNPRTDAIRDQPEPQQQQNIEAEAEEDREMREEEEEKEAQAMEQEHPPQEINRKGGNEEQEAQPEIEEEEPIEEEQSQQQEQQEQEAEESPKQVNNQQRQQAPVNEDQQEHQEQPEQNPSQHHEQAPQQHEQQPVVQEEEPEEGEGQAPRQLEQIHEQQQNERQLKEPEDRQNIQASELVEQEGAAADQQPPAEQLLQIEKQVEAERDTFEAQRVQQYIHKLQRELIASSQSISSINQQLQSNHLANSSLIRELESSRQSNMQLRRKKLEVELEKTKLIKECEKLRRENEVQRKKLEQVEAIGDVFTLKSTLEEVKLLAEAQIQEIAELKRQNEEFKNSINMDQQITIFRKYQQREALSLSKLDNLTAHNQQLTSELNMLRNTVPDVENRLQQALNTIKQLQTLRSHDQETIAQWQQKWSQFESERESNRKARELEQSIFSYESEKNINQQQELLHLNILSDREEKELLMREYLLLESKNKELTYDIQDLTAKLRRLEREKSKVHANFVSKKQYMDLNAKYNKAKKCLEGTFQQLRHYRAETHSQAISEEVSELLEGVEARECQLFIKNTNQIVSNLQQQVDSIEQKSLSNDLQLELAHGQSVIASLKKEISQNERILRLMDDDIHLKNRIIKEKNEVIERLRNTKASDEGEEKSRFAKLQSQMKGLKETISVYQTQNIILVRQISSLGSQLKHWKHMYEQIKDNLTEKITLSFNPEDKRLPNQQMQEEEARQTCKECQLRKISLLETKESQSQQTQTDNLYDYYYREIKQYLNFLKRTSKEYDHIPTTTKELVKAVAEIKDRFVAEFKEKFEKIHANYRSKLEEIRKEKAENESWRTRAREEIREEFQDIRQLVINNRLINALRQAKNLIDYLEKEVQNHQENQEEMEEQGAVSEEKKNE